MAIIRRPVRSKFSPISNALLQNSDLSFECRGMLAYLLSKPDAWQAQTKDIEREGRIGKGARRTMMKDAEHAGYLTFHTARNKQGQLESWYDVHEEPVPEECRTKSWETGKAKPGTDEPHPDNRSSNQPGTDEPHPVGPTPSQPGAGQPGAGERGDGSSVPLIKTDGKNTEEENTEKKILSECEAQTHTDLVSGANAAGQADSAFGASAVANEPQPLIEAICQVCGVQELPDEKKCPVAKAVQLCSSLNITSADINAFHDDWYFIRKRKFPLTLSILTQDIGSFVHSRNIHTGNGSAMDHRFTKGEANGKSRFASENAL